MAIENDYNLLVWNLNELAKTINGIHEEVRRGLTQEARDELEPNETRWVQTILTGAPWVSGLATQLEGGARQVLHSRPGEAVFDAQPPPAPDAPPED